MRNHSWKEIGWSRGGNLDTDSDTFKCTVCGVELKIKVSDSHEMEAVRAKEQEVDMDCDVELVKVILGL